MTKTNESNVISKVINVLRAFVDQQPEWGVRDLGRYLNMPTSSVHRFLLQMQEEGIIEFDSSINKYKIGVEMIRISSLITSNLDINKIVKPFMQQLVDKYKETVCLVLYHRLQRKIIFVDKINGSHALQYIIQLGALQSVPYGASGKSILAFLEKNEMEIIFKEEGFTDSKIKELEEELALVRKKGVSSTQNDRTEGSKGIASPIFNSFAQPIGSLLYTVPISRYKSEYEQEISADIKKITTEISSILGYTLKG
ncbi:MAG: putative transcriptional regulatory protein [Paenibacillus sp.]|jgi:DNA-binding IclR family transcriptional regulator|nr:putative transcriptional regulatory protein [Paenibacillus sp.]